MDVYLLTDIDKKYASNFMKLRISNSKLMIEEGRHNNAPMDNRICSLCPDNEMHFVISFCKKLFSLRQKLFDKLNEINSRIYEYE